jgi:hypothetical protein
MAEIGFYHLTRTDELAALPALLSRTLAAGERALVLCGSADRVAALDDALWRSGALTGCRTAPPKLRTPNGSRCSSLPSPPILPVRNFSSDWTAWRPM